MFCAFEVDRLYQDSKFCDRIEAAMVRWVSRRLKPTSSKMLTPWELEDVCQEAFVKTFRRFEIPPRPGSPQFVAYSMKAARSGLREKRSKHKFIAASLSGNAQAILRAQALTDDSQWEVSSSDLDEELQAFRHELSEIEDRILCWMIEERQGVEKMAQELGISKSTLER